MPKVAIVRCEDYRQENVDLAVAKAIDLLGGIRKFIRTDATVLLKPNLLSAHEPEKGVTTHPAVVIAVAKQIKKVVGKCFLGDGPADQRFNMKKLWQITGMQYASDTAGIELVNFETSGVITKRGGNGRELNIAKPIIESDSVVNLPKLKTHGLTIITGAVKNLFGAIPGYGKAEWHKKMPHDYLISEVFVDLLQIIKPRLHIMDSVISMEGEGPGVTGSLRKVGLILASDDGVALDAVATALIGLNPTQIATTRIGASRKLGEANLARIDILGEQLQNITISDFKLPTSTVRQKIPVPILRVAGKLVWVRPKINPSACTHCGLCIRSCPMEAISGSSSGLKINYRKCIVCLCCHEICPSGAVILKKSLLAKLVFR